MHCARVVKNVTLLPNQALMAGGHVTHDLRRNVRLSLGVYDDKESCHAGVHSKFNTASRAVFFSLQDDDPRENERRARLRAVIWKR